MDTVNILELLKKHGQDHLITHYEMLDQNKKNIFLNQIERIDWDIFKALQKEDTSSNKGTFEPLGALTLDQIRENEDDYREIGKQAIRAGEIGAILLAGGQGTRLGFDKSKGMFNIGIQKEVYIFECLFRNLLDVTYMTGAFIPLYIMTSEINNNDIIAFLREKNYFGYPKEYVSFFVQDMAPSIDFDHKLLIEEEGRLSLSPNGNGGWFSSMEKAGLLSKAKNAGVKWLNIFAVDNVLQRICDPLFIGATISSGCVSGSKVVRKAAPEERVGVLCLENGKPSIIEYYEMTEDMLYQREESGNLSYAFGVTLNYLFRIDKLEEIMDNYMPVHIVEKKIPYLDDIGRKVNPEKPNGYKFEQLILDMIRLMDNCLPYEVERDREFAPIKNKMGVDSVESARALLLKNGVEL